MYAVIQIGNHQYQVEPGKRVAIEKLDAPTGSEVEFADVVMVSKDGNVLVGPKVQAKVRGRITDQARGPKLIAYKRLKRKGFQKKIGHRQDYTEVEITNIEV